MKLNLTNVVIGACLGSAMVCWVQMDSAFAAAGWLAAAFANWGCAKSMDAVIMAGRQLHELKVKLLTLHTFYQVHKGEMPEGITDAQFKRMLEGRAKELL